MIDDPTMDDDKHTPRAHGGATVVINDDPVTVQSHMIAAAPMMLIELRVLRAAAMAFAKRLDNEPGNQIAVAALLHRIQRADAVIAQAEGRS